MLIEFGRKDTTFLANNRVFAKLFYNYVPVHLFSIIFFRFFVL